MKYTFFAITDKGRIRANNEDCVVFDEAAQIGVLADGMGGYNAGEVASGMASAAIKSELTSYLLAATPPVQTGDLKRAIALCVAKANRAILDAAIANPRYAGMGTTLVLGVFQGDRLVVGHVGDSRCYRWRATTLLQITKDHSLLQEQIDAGWLTPAQAATAPNKHLVTRALGVQAEVQLELSEYPVEPGDIYLMCSDGLSDMMPDAAMAAVLQKGASLAQMATELVALANQNGGRDNIAVLLIEATAVVAKRSLAARWLGK